MIIRHLSYHQLAVWASPSR